MDLKDLIPQEKLNLVRASAYEGGEKFADGIKDNQEPIQLIRQFRKDLNRCLDLIEEMGIEE